MNELFFKVERAGVFSTFQDEGYSNLQHLGISSGGVMDINLFKLSNKLLHNSLNEGVIEFAYQGPRLKLIKGTAKIVITGNVHFNIERHNSKDSNKKFNAFQTYELKEGDILDILATKQSVYGYLSIQGGFKIDRFYNTASTLTRSRLGPNKGNKILNDQNIFFLKNSKDNINYKVSYNYKETSNTIRVLSGPQENFFAKESLNKFFSSTFKISNNVDRMGIRLEGHKVINIRTPDIPSEGIVKGAIQIPGDGNPIILMADHPTIGGYPKIATVIITDFAKISQLSPGKDITFKKVAFIEAEEIFKKNNKFLNNIFNQIEKI